MSGQATAVISNQVITLAGVPVPYATVRICPSTGSGIPCTPLASIYADANATTPLPNPLTTDQNGWFSAFVAGSTAFYQVQTTPSTTTNYSFYANGGSSGGGGGGTPGAPTTSVQINVNGVFTGYSSLLYTPLGGLQVGGPIVGFATSFQPHTSQAASFTVDTYSPCTMFTSIFPNAACDSQYGTADYTLPANLTVSGSLSAQNLASIGPRYDVTQFGAVGNGTTDDTAAIQAAFNACWANAANSRGGIVEFPGRHTYLITSTINTYDSCRIEGITGSNPTHVSNEPVIVQWGGAAYGVAATITSFTISTNSTPLYPLNNPIGITPYGFLVTYNTSGANPYSIGDWVYGQGFTTAQGLYLNNSIAQVVATTSSSYTTFLLQPTGWTQPANGTYTDAGSAVNLSVLFATDSVSRYDESITGIQWRNGAVHAYFGGRMDTGSFVKNTWSLGASYFGYYFGGGVTSYSFDDGWRADGAGVANIFIQGSGSYLSLQNGQTTVNGSTPHGAGIVLNNQGCGALNLVTKLNMHSTITEAGFNYASPLNMTPAAPGASIVLIPCETTTFPTQFLISMDQQANGVDAGVTYAPQIVMYPQNDSALNLHIANSIIPNTTANPRWVGIPALIRQDASPSMSSTEGFISRLDFSPARKSETGIGTNAAAQGSIEQDLGDYNFVSLWQYGLRASACLYSDAAFTLLPNATTLFAGQEICPASYWNGANGLRYAIQVVYTAGTTGTPNSGGTTCTAPGGTALATCTSGVDLSEGQFVTLNGGSHPISKIDATNPSAVVITSGSGNFSAITNGALTFTAPVLGPEMQFPTKSAAAPTTLAWSQGDFEQNSGATANGICGWVNVAAGTPGTWTAVPCANLTGGLSTAQIGTGTPAAGKYVDGAAGAWTALPIPVNAAITTATGGTNTGTVTCVTAACTNISGTYSVAGGTFTTGNLLVLVWPTTTTAYRCWTVQNGLATNYGIGHSVATATGMTITNAVSVTGVTTTIDYGCSQY